LVEEAAAFNISPRWVTLYCISGSLSIVCVSLHLILTDDRFILIFARGCKYSIEKMKRKIDLSLTMKTMMPEIFAGWDPMTPINQLALGYGIFLPLPGYDPLGRKIMIYRMGCFPTDKITAEELEKASGMVSEIMGLEGE